LVKLPNADTGLFIPIANHKQATISNRFSQLAIDFNMLIFSIFSGLLIYFDHLYYYSIDRTRNRSQWLFCQPESSN
jgi:hypothetical protein